MSDDTDFDDVVEALYVVASDPERWEEIVDILPLEPIVETSDIAADLRRSVLIADRVAERDAARGTPLAPAVIELSAALKVERANAAGMTLLAAGQHYGARLALADDASELAFDRAMQRLSPLGAMVVFALAHDPRRRLGRLSRRGRGYALTLLPDPKAMALDRTLGLTSAEAKLATEMRSAESLGAAAANLNISVNTARNQLAAIFEKLGVRRQSQLLQILTELATLGEDDAGVSFSAAAPTQRILLRPDGRTLAYRIYGDPRGRPVLAFHEGLGSSLLPPQTEATAVRLGLMIVAADRPGYGQSDPLMPYDPHIVAGDMRALCDALGLDEMILLGLLSGVTPMLATAHVLQPRVREVVLLSGRAPQYGRTVEDTPLTAFRARLLAHPWVTPTLFRILKTRISPETAARMLRRAARQSPGDAAYLAANPWVADFVSGYVKEALAGDGLGPADELAAERHPASQGFATVSAPIRVVHGSEDRLAPLSALRAVLAGHPHEETVYPGIGQLMALKHWVEILESL